ncbi:hypothetical protein EGR_01996 [Echinococcus granulosus]|uniref:Uncharacterized protein n=1 Tax=Echinococcus granulosus TaxID=6210 RepID=W6UXC3_ECHGR|nr:hypothetical protein EGR_01996 [Echinococcus granulosus]EUB63192.1 hypothetical protein EGR_01996 [Echinococcus granulosus]
MAELNYSTYFKEQYGKTGVQMWNFWHFSSKEPKFFKLPSFYSTKFKIILNVEVDILNNVFTGKAHSALILKASVSSEMNINATFLSIKTQVDLLHKEAQICGLVNDKAQYHLF